MSRVQAIYSIDIGVNDFLKIVEKDAPVDMDISYIREYYYKKVEKFRDKYRKGRKYCKKILKKLHVFESISDLLITNCPNKTKKQKTSIVCCNFLIFNFNCYVHFIHFT